MPVQYRSLVSVNDNTAKMKKLDNKNSELPVAAAAAAAAAAFRMPISLAMAATVPALNLNNLAAVAATSTLAGHQAATPGSVEGHSFTDSDSEDEDSQQPIVASRNNIRHSLTTSKCDGKFSSFNSISTLETKQNGHFLIQTNEICNSFDKR